MRPLKELIHGEVRCATLYAISHLDDEAGKLEWSVYVGGLMSQFASKYAEWLWKCTLRTEVYLVSYLYDQTRADIYRPKFEITSVLEIGMLRGMFRNTTSTLRT